MGSVQIGRTGPRPAGSSGPVMAHLAMLLALLLVVLGMMLFMLHYARRIERQERQMARAARSGSVATVAAARPPAAQRPGDPTGAITLQPVQLSRLAGFRDHRRNLPVEPYCYLLHLARLNPPGLMERLARRDVTIAQLLHDPEQYRGQLLYLRGRLRRLIRDTLPENDYGLTVRYEGWLFTNESGPMPYMVIVTEPPEGLPLGGEINEPASVAGYFLGWWKYTNQEGRAWSAPVVLGRRFVARRRPPLRPDAAWSTAYGLAAGAVVLALLLTGAYLSARRATPRYIGTNEETGQGRIEFIENQAAADAADLPSSPPAPGTQDP